MMNQKRHIQKLKSTFYSIFKNRDPFDSMFNEHIKQKIILCPTDGYYLDEKQFNALMKTIRQIDENSFYLSEVEFDDFTENLDAQNIHNPGHWELNNETSYEDYRNNLIILENALYSPKGTWGLIISHEDHAVLVRFIMGF